MKGKTKVLVCGAGFILVCGICFLYVPKHRTTQEKPELTANMNKESTEHEEGSDKSTQEDKTMQEDSAEQTENQKPTVALSSNDYNLVTATKEKNVSVKKKETDEKKETEKEEKKEEKHQPKEEPITAISWETAVSRAMRDFEDGGGYLTNLKLTDSLKAMGFQQTAWQGMDQAFHMDSTDIFPDIQVAYARPSFCSSAAYMLLLKSISIWDSEQTTRAVSSAAWQNLRPITLDTTNPDGTITPRQDDGFGCWGRANANADGFAVLIHEVDAGKNYYVGTREEYQTDTAYYDAWNAIQRMDFLKIFWNEYIGCGEHNESGHMVLYLGSKAATDAFGNRDDILYYWSSNGSKADVSKGYGVQTTRMSKIKRAVYTHITKPENFDQARKIAPYDEQPFLSAINGQRNGSVEEVKRNAGIE